MDDVTIHTNQSFYDSELDDRSETPTNNNSEPSTPVDEKQALGGESLTRENINACIANFSKMWAPAEKYGGTNDHINNNSDNDKFGTIQSTRSDSFRWTDFKRNGILRPTDTNSDSLTLEIDPNAWDLPTPSNPFTDPNVSNSAISETTSPFHTPRGASPIDGGHTQQENNIELISNEIENDRSVTDEEDNQSTFDIMHLMLEPHLRPVSPDPDDQTSNEIFEEHKRLAKEYFKVNTNTKKNIRNIEFRSLILQLFRRSDSNRNRLHNQTQRRITCRYGSNAAARTIRFMPKTRRKGASQSIK